MYIVTREFPGTEHLSDTWGVFQTFESAHSKARERIGDLKGVWETHTFFRGFNGHHAVIVRVQYFNVQPIVVE